MLVLNQTFFFLGFVLVLKKFLRKMVERPFKKEVQEPGALFWAFWVMIGVVTTLIFTSWKVKAGMRPIKKLINFSLSQWLNFQLFGITYLVGKIKFKLFFSGSIG